MTTLNVSMLLLWIVVFVLLGFVLALARQVGVLYERIAPIGALTIEAGLKVGDEAPLFDLDDIDGRPIAIGRPSLRSTLLFFMSPDCPVCKKLIPIVLSLHRAEVALLDVVFASDGSIDEHKAFLKRVSVGTTPYVLSTKLGVAYQVAKLPYAVLIDEQGRIASQGLVNNREQLESLLTAKELGVRSLQEFRRKQVVGAQSGNVKEVIP